MTALARDYVVETANTEEIRFESMRLRYQVYCRERGFLPDASPNALETDEFDHDSRHVVLRQRDSGEVVGTVRVVPVRQGPGLGLPMFRYCDQALLRHLPQRSLGEVSRFALSLERRNRSAAADALLRLGLMQGILEVSAEMGLTHWAAIMEPALIRLLQGTGVRFEACGPMVQCSGLRQPCVAEIGQVLDHGRRQRPEAYHFVTRGIAKHPARLAA